MSPSRHPGLCWWGGQSPFSRGVCRSGGTRAPCGRSARPLALGGWPVCSWSSRSPAEQASLPLGEGGRPRAGLWDPPTTGFLLRFLVVGEKQQSQWLLPGPGSGRRRPRDPLPLPRDVLSGARGGCTPRRGEVRAGGAGRSRLGPGFGQRGDPQGNPRPGYTETRAFGAKQALGESRHIPRLSFPIQQTGPQRYLTSRGCCADQSGSRGKASAAAWAEPGRCHGPHWSLPAELLPRDLQPGLRPESPGGT